MIRKRKRTQIGWSIYLWTNLITGEKYYGQSKDLEARTNAHKKGYKNPKPQLIDLKIHEYGFENFKVEEIESGIPTKEEANSREAFFISSENTLHPNGYNLKWRDNGNGVVSQKTKEKLSRSKQGIRKGGSGKFLGVKKNSRGKPFVTTVAINRRLTAKSFDNEIEAAEAYDKMVLVVYGVDARLNFEEKRNSYLEENLLDFYNFFLKSLVEKKSKYKWIGLSGKDGRWRCRCLDPVSNRIPPLAMGSFATEEEAAKIADKVSYFYLGATKEELNFPELYEQLVEEDLNSFFSERLKRKTSKYVGVSFLPSGKWKAYINVNSKQFILGSYFKTQEEAFAFREKYLQENKKLK